jgi:CHASE2 domain-containing sensor protein
MKFLLILAPLIVAALSYVMYKEDGNIKKLIITFLLLWAVITLAIVGNVMRSLTPLFLTHIVAIVIAYGAIIYYVLKNKFIWLAVAAPVLTMLIYLVFVWIGNEHLPSIA